MSVDDELAQAATAVSHNTVTSASDAGAAPTVPGARGAAGTDDVPPRIGRYRVLRRLGAGGMGVVYAAHDPELDRTVAIKLVRDRFEGNPALEERLRREAQALARLQHPNVVSVYDVGVADDRLYIVMQYVDGGPLDEWIEGRGAREIVAAFLAAGRGLAAAHAAGLVHRDFKPGNVLVEKDGTVRVTDFGLARLSHLADLPVGESQEGLARSVTSNDVVGTPAYMAPEQFLGGAITAATDQFGYCVSLWEALVGTRPFAGESFAEIRNAVTEGEINGGAARAMPRRIQRALRRGLARRAADRFPDMPSLLDVLTPPRRWWLGGVAAIALGGAGALFASTFGAFGAHTAANPCKGVDGDVAAVWNDARRGAVIANDAVLAALDDRAASWRTMRIDACEANRVRHAEDDATTARRVACLDRSLAGLRAAVDLLASQGQAIHGNALVLAHSGADAKSCTAAGARVPAAEPDADLLRRVAELDARSIAADFTRVLADGPPLAQALEDAGDPEDAALAWYDVGATGDSLPTDQILADLRKAAALAARAGDDALTARAWAMVASTQANHDDLSGADDALGMADAAAQRVHDEQTELFVAVTRGEVAEKRGDYDRSEQICKDALARSTAAFGDDALTTDNALACLAQVYQQTGRYEDGLPIEERILALRRRTSGDDGALTIDARLRVALCRYALGDRDAAKAEIAATLDRVTAIAGADSLMAMDDWSDVSIAESEGGNVAPPEAVDAATRALAIGKARLPAGDPRLARLLANDANIEYAAGKHDLSAAEYEAALAIYEKQHDLRTWASTAYNASDVYRLGGDCARASTILERVVSISDAGEADQLVGAAGRAALGDCQVKTHHVDQGIATMTAAVKDLVALGQDAFAAQYMLEIADADAKKGDRAGARAQARAVKALLTDDSDTSQQARKEADAYLK